MSSHHKYITEQQQLLHLVEEWRTTAAEGDLPDPNGAIGDIVAEMHEADLADALESMPPNARMGLWHCIPDSQKVQVLPELSDATRPPLLADAEEETVAELLRQMPPDDVASMLRDFTLPARARLLRLSGLAENRRLRDSLAFGEDTVGAVMDFNAVIAHETDTIGGLCARLQKRGELPSHCDKLFITDHQDYLTGVLPLKRLLLNPPSASVRDVMVAKDVHSFRPLDDVEKAAGAFERYDLISAPVLDDSNKIAGRITIDEIVDHLRESSELKLINSAGVAEEEDLFASLPRRFANRGQWLFINVLAVFIISLVVGAFEDTIMRVVALAALMPIVAGLSGNAGNQTATLTVRALALDQINTLNWHAVVRGELLLAIINGMTWGAVTGAFAYLVYGRIDLSLVLTASMICCFTAAAAVGFFFPLLMKRMGKDPALGASVVLTSVVDTLGFFVFLGMGALFLA